MTDSLLHRFLLQNAVFDVTNLFCHLLQLWQGLANLVLKFQHDFAHLPLFTGRGISKLVALQFECALVGIEF